MIPQAENEENFPSMVPLADEPGPYNPEFGDTGNTNLDPMNNVLTQSQTSKPFTMK